MPEIVKHESGAILFKPTAEEKKVMDLEKSNKELKDSNSELKERLSKIEELLYAQIKTSADAAPIEEKPVEEPKPTTRKRKSSKE